MSDTTARDACLRNFEQALEQAHLGLHESITLVGPQTLRRFDTAKEALITAHRCGHTGNVPAADSWLLQALYYELDT